MAKKIDAMQVWLDEAVRLRADMLTTEVTFYMYLVEGERVAPWRGKYTDFEQMLATTHLCAPQRYAAFRDALAQVNGVAHQNIHSLGVDGVIEAGRIQEAEKRERFVTRVVASHKKQGCPLSVKRIKEIGREEAPVLRPVRSPVDKSPEQLKAENTALRKENERLRKENERLKSALQKMRDRTAAWTARSSVEVAASARSRDDCTS